MAFRKEIYLGMLDWLLVIATSFMALLLLNVNPDEHHFSVLDLNISYGHRAQAKVSLPLLILLSVIMPALTIALLTLDLFGFISRSAHGRAFLAARLRSLNLGLLGLGVSLATATVILNVKNLAGKPRPDFLERCRPNVDNIDAYAVGAGYGKALSDRWVMATREICQADRREVSEGLRSFPSGYATIAFAGLWYLTLYLSARFGIFKSCDSVRNLVDSGDSNPGPARSGDEGDAGELETFIPRPGTPRQGQSRQSISPSTFLLILPYTSLGLAIFIAGTRYFDFRNHGFDVLAGAAAGTTAASFAFRLYGQNEVF